MNDAFEPRKISAHFRREARDLEREIDKLERELSSLKARKERLEKQARVIDENLSAETQDALIDWMYSKREPTSGARFRTCR